METSETTKISEITSFLISGVERAAAYLSVLTIIAALPLTLGIWIVLHRLDWAALAFLACALIFSAYMLFLFRRYHAQPVIRRLGLLESKAKTTADEVRDLQSRFDLLRQHHHVMDSERRTQIDTIKPAYREKSADLNALFQAIDERERSEIKTTLEAYQEAFVRSAIADASIRRVRVPGFTPRVLEKLEEAGILTAVDITPERLRVIPNLDPFLIQELDLWRQRIEREAEAHKPLSLPDLRLNPILEYYKEERMAIKASLEGLVIGMQGEIMKIEGHIGDRLVHANALEETLSTRINQMSKEYVELREAIRPLERYTFVRYFRTCLGLKR